MAHHRVYGGCLRTEIAIETLPISAPCPADWVVRQSNTCEPLLDSIRLGEERLLDTVSARLDRAADRFRLSFDDTGIFDVSLDGRNIVWIPAPNADPDLSQTDLIGRVLALAIHAGGDLCLHASAVVVDGKAIAFLAPKGFGKSSLGMALVAQGGKLLTDDTLRLKLGGPPVATPGPHSVRLWHDVADQLGRRSSMTEEPDSGKLVARALPDDEVSSQSVLLDALYILAPTRVGTSRDESAVRRQRLAPTAATLGVLQHAKIALLLGKSEGAALLARAAAVVGTVPVFRLEVPRDLEALSAVATQLLAWHGLDFPTDDVNDGGDE